MNTETQIHRLIFGLSAGSAFQNIPDSPGKTSDAGRRGTTTEACGVHTPQGGASESYTAEEAWMVDQAERRRLDIAVEVPLC